MAKRTVAKRKTSSRSERKITQRGQCRIIAGKWRGRIIRFEDADGLRPTTDRIRETVFNWLQAVVPQSYCLDCFAGSGVLGFEAISRGAKEVVFVEQNKTTIKNIRDNCRHLDADNAVIVHQDSLAWLIRISAAGLNVDQGLCEGQKGCQKDRQEELQKERLKQKFNLVFLDPPFDSNLLETSSALINSSGSLADDAIIYVEHAINKNVTLPENWLCLKEKRSGQVSYKIYQNRT